MELKKQKFIKVEIFLKRETDCIEWSDFTNKDKSRVGGSQFSNPYLIRVRGN